MSREFPPGGHRVSLSPGGHDRSYLFHVPPALGPLPLVMMLHGAGGSAQFAADETGWSQLADKAGFTVVYPEGVPVYPKRVSKFLTNPQEWNDGSGRGHEEDVGFLLAVLDDLDHIADLSRVYITGFSNGAGMAFRFTAEHADRVAAIAPVAGHCWVADPHPSRTVPTFYLTGDADPLMPIDGGQARTPWGKVQGRPAVADTLHRWAAAIGQPPGSELFPVRIIADHGHHWPGGKALLGERLGGLASPAVDATDEIWDFLRRHKTT
jgi:polyhydroxybutyrate depolymerase